MRIIIFLLLISHQMQAQSISTPRFVEFIIEDAITVEADKLDYIIIFEYNFYQNYEENDENINKTEKAERRLQREKVLQETINALKAYAKEQKVVFKPNPIVIKGDESYYNLRLGFINFENTEEFKQKIEKLNEIKYIRKALYFKSSSSEEEAYQTLTKQLIKKGKEKAQLYADLIQAKVGKILQITELHPNDSPIAKSGGWVVYPPLSALPEEVIYSDNISKLNIENDDRTDTKIILSKAIQMRFELE